MRKHFCLAAAVAVSLGSAHAVVVVNGAAGEDADNTSPFETLQAAVNFANAGSETVVEIQTNGPLGGVSLREVNLAHPLTIQAGAGFSPVLNAGLDLVTTNTTHLITLTDLNISTTGLGTPLLVGGNLTATNCVFNTNPAAGAYGPAVTAAVTSAGTVGTLTLVQTGDIGHEIDRRHG